MAYLRVLSGDNKNKIYPLDVEKKIVGRDSEEIPVLDQGVSRRHAEIFRVGEMYLVRDLGSRNGTFVNEQRVDEWVLRVGDRVQVGNTVLVFEDKFAREQDSRIISFTNTAEQVGSTLSIKLPSEESALPTDGEEHARLRVLYRISRYLGTGEDVDEITAKIASAMAHALDAEHVYLFAFDKDDTGEFRLVAAYDRRPVEGLMVSRSILQRVRDEKRPILSSDAMMDDRFATHHSVMIKNIKSLLCVPLLVMNQPVGAFYATNSKLSEVFSPEDLEFATTVGMLVGNAFEMWELVEKQGRLYRSVLKILAGSSEVRAPEHRGRSERIATYSAAMGRALGYSDERTQRLWIAGLLHDLGALGMSEGELKNSINLEQRKIRCATDFLEKLPALAEVAPAITLHHERHDGSGFPHGLKGDAIPEDAQFVGLACELDAMLTHGGENDGELPVRDALARIRDLSGTKFSSTAINALLIAYRRNRLFQPDTQVFRVGL
ncbi:MAG: HD domain-containing phosphohydrolase [Planctomycetota bacterium]